MTLAKILARWGTPALLAVFALSAQTLEQAEALRKAHRYVDANEVFRVLVEQNPKNADYRERWGRLYMDVGQEDEAGKLFTEALEIKKDHARALLGLAE
ncbi:MAG TPA: tetratricopeptide repeat protein, partial [Bryobacteraceae bacterium]|nr:tetratricopeptide repeat protein [Bryobacteraceae bacterium]